MSGDLDGRLSDLEGGLGRCALALLGHEDARLRSCVLELQPQAEPGEAAPENCDVVAVSRLLVGQLALLYPSSEIRLIAFGLRSTAGTAQAATTAPRASRSISSIPGSISSAWT